jgi:hypothetical protein
MGKKKKHYLQGSNNPGSIHFIAARNPGYSEVWNFWIQLVVQ